MGIDLLNSSENTNLSNWYCINDGVMGGVSEGRIALDKMGVVVFQGRVSTENNGGFASVRCQTGKVNLNGFKGISIFLKGDGKTYQFRLKERDRDQFSYAISFNTNNDWQEIKIAFAELIPVFRGQKLAMSNFKGEYMHEFGFLIGDKQTTPFCLQLKSIKLV